MNTEISNRIDYAARDAAETLALRWLSGTLALWGLCAKTACRHARRCRREPRDCLRQYVPLVPEEAREGARAMLSGLERHITFDELYEEFPDEIYAVAAWAELVEACASRRDVTGAR